MAAAYIHRTMITSPRVRWLRLAIAGAAGLSMVVFLGSLAAGDEPPIDSATQPSAVARDEAARRAALFSLTVEPPHPVASQCTSTDDLGNIRVLAGETLRLRVSAILPDGRTVDVTGSPALRYKSFGRAASVAPGGWVTFHPGEGNPLVGVNVRSDRGLGEVRFAVVTPSRVDLPEGVRALIARDFPGLRIPDTSDVTYDWIGARDGSPYAWRADFDGNGLEDDAVLLIGKSDWKVVIFTQTGAGVFEAAHVEAGRYGPGLHVECPQEIRVQLLDSESTRPGLYFELTYENRFKVYWQDGAFVRESVDDNEGD